MEVRACAYRATGRIYQGIISGYTKTCPLCGTDNPITIAERQWGETRDNWQARAFAALVSMASEFALVPELVASEPVESTSRQESALPALQRKQSFIRSLPQSWFRGYLQRGQVKHPNRDLPVLRKTK